MAEASRRTSDRKNSSPVPRAVPSTMSRSARRSSRTAGTSEPSQSATPKAASSTCASNSLLSLVLTLIGDLSNRLPSVIGSSAGCGCDRASAKDFRKIREFFILRVAAVPPSTTQRLLKNIAFLVKRQDGFQPVTFRERTPDGSWYVYLISSLGNSLHHVPQVMILASGSGSRRDRRAIGRPAGGSGDCNPSPLLI